MNLSDGGKAVTRAAICAVLVAFVQGTPALAGAYRVELQVPPGGRLLHGHGGVGGTDTSAGPPGLAWRSSD